MNKELAANTTLSHYRIVSKLGAGRTETDGDEENKKE